MRKERVGKVSYPLPKAPGAAAEPPSPEERKIAWLKGRHRWLAVCEKAAAHFLLQRKC